MASGDARRDRRSCRRLVEVEWTPSHEHPVGWLGLAKSEFHGNGSLASALFGPVRNLTRPAMSFAGS
jgi:hypothetical protein